MQNAPLQSTPAGVLQRVLQAAKDTGASDVHIRSDSPFALRVSGELQSIDAPAPGPEEIEEIIRKITPPALSGRLEQRKEIDLSYLCEGVGRFRTNIYYEKGRPCISMRRVNDVIPSFAELNLPPILEELSRTVRGIVLVAGTTGSGKSTTLAAMVQYINEQSRRHIITLEDPIEYLFQDSQSLIDQREIGLDTASFHEALRYVFRQDPDVIMIGEMRDAESFRTALSAAETGHLVLSSLHTTDASRSVTRILEFFREEERSRIRRQLSGSLRAVMCQRLIPAVSGGLIPAVEVLLNTPTVRRILEEDSLEKLHEAIARGTGDGMIGFDQCLLELANSGRITRDEALAKATNPDAMKMQLQGIYVGEEKRLIS